MWERGQAFMTVSKLCGVCKTMFKTADMALYLLSRLNSDTLWVGLSVLLNSFSASSDNLPVCFDTLYWSLLCVTGSETVPLLWWALAFLKVSEKTVVIAWNYSMPQINMQEIICIFKMPPQQRAPELLKTETSWERSQRSLKFTAQFGQDF